MRQRGGHKTGMKRDPLATCTEDSRLHFCPPPHESCFNGVVVENRHKCPPAVSPQNEQGFLETASTHLSKPWLWSMDPFTGGKSMMSGPGPSALQRLSSHVRSKYIPKEMTQPFLWQGAVGLVLNPWRGVCRS